jgi:hypothetical protein
MIDNTASLWANGVRASLTLAAASDLAHWAPFTIARAFATNAPIRLSESSADLGRSLPAATVLAPYRWTFGDGAAAVGHVVTHRYARPGIYKVTVYGLYSRTQGAPSWIPFDSARLQIALPGQLARANAAYAAQSAFGAAATTYLWLAEGALVVVAVSAGLGFLWRHRKPASARRGARPAVLPHAAGDSPGGS